MLQRPEVVIFEAAIRFGSFLIRIDILHKSAGRIDLLEVKAKSWDSTPGKSSLVTGKGTISSDWVPFLEDAAFQTWVARQAGLGVPIVPYLLLVDKSAVVEGDGLHQLFRIERDGSRVQVRITDQVLAERLGRTVLCRVPLGDHVDAIIEGTSGITSEQSDACGPSLPDRANLFATYLTGNQPMPASAPIGTDSKK